MRNIRNIALATALLTGGCSSSPETLEFTFDDLGGGYEEIFLYPGGAEEYRGQDVTYVMSGQLATAECAEVGRSVESDTSVGEKPKASTLWLRIEDSKKAVYPNGLFATVVYTNLSEADTTALPAC